MKSFLFYFSSTGNSLSVAKQIQKSLPETDVINMAENPGQEYIIKVADMVGFIFPVHAWGPPIIVSQFIQNLNIKDVSYIFSVLTSAGNNGAAFSLFEKIINKRNIRNTAVFELTMPSNYLLNGKNISEDENVKILDKTDQTLQDIIKRIGEKRSIFPEINSDRIKMSQGHNNFRRKAPLLDANFRATEHCTACGICIRVCPTSNISIHNREKPRWHHNCVLCLGCIHICPLTAIEYGYITPGLKRYRHRDITLEELCIPRVCNQP